jgi:GMP synthase-like glutamine amidotransferase
VTRTQRALVIHHDANSDAGLVGRALDEYGIERVEHFVCTEIDSPVAAGPFPPLDDVDLLVALGSRWSVYDHASIGGWIDDELELLRDADRRGIATLGICFGSQALAAAHGGAVTVSPTPEVGWYHVESSVAEVAPGPWFQWHFDCFEAPPGAELLASSPASPQAFRLRRNLGLQFHPELDRHLLELWMVNDRADIESAGLEPDRLLEGTDRLAPVAWPHTRRLVEWFLDEFADPYAAEQPSPTRR